MPFRMDVAKALYCQSFAGPGHLPSLRLCRNVIPRRYPRNLQSASGQCLKISPPAFAGAEMTAKREK